jgi:hypothetical protein
MSGTLADLAEMRTDIHSMASVVLEIEKDRKDAVIKARSDAQAFDQQMRNFKFQEPNKMDEMQKAVNDIERAAKAVIAFFSTALISWTRSAAELT